MECSFREPGGFFWFFLFRERFSASATVCYPPKEDHFCRIQGHVPGAIFSMTTTALPVARRSREHCH
ncbi:hypothetical protein KC19_1G071300 [Ceratodon purpureus]|uniref:Uncharacterized protein n=1 Tax=Ceratodon purpureus TaxID=3225 RepID=A0A8T0J5M4_CERPU|nr:hypothetical protein KC19_1G071300 [Ceratodon purpureus]